MNKGVNMFILGKNINQSHSSPLLERSGIIITYFFVLFAFTRITWDQTNIKNSSISDSSSQYINMGSFIK